ncbi:MAG: hypothetical protein J6X18_05695 [Bacteroidales bacterium]|nr:hypothetical protein [Bacteroidales bacterium]
MKRSQPVKVYKVFTKFLDHEGKKSICSPYYTFKEWEPGVNYCATEGYASIDENDKKLAELLKAIYDNKINGAELSCGAFHSFVNREDAEELSERLRKSFSYAEKLSMHFMRETALVVGECTVPQDSDYVFYGNFDMMVLDDEGNLTLKSYFSVASSNLILDRILEN